MPLSFPVSVEKNESLRKRMSALDLLESDLEESFIKSGGKGGQNVNKVSTAVYLLHKPTGTDVKCSVYRTQGLNRYKARVLLCEKIEILNHPKSSSKETERLKIIKRKKDKLRKTKKLKIADLKNKEFADSIQNDHLTLEE
nr:peptide chain release factor-like protein [Leptospira kobayashii]